MVKKKLEMFEAYSDLEHKYSVSHIPKIMCEQERDWSCSVAGLRTIVSAIVPNLPSEEYIIKKSKIKPGLKYSGEIREWKIWDELDVQKKFGCENVTITFDGLLSLLEDDWYIMVQTMVNYSHWMILCGYYCVEPDDFEKNSVLCYDSYYDTMRLFPADEFIEMWRDGAFVESHVERDFVAVKAKE